MSARSAAGPNNIGARSSTPCALPIHTGAIMSFWNMAMQPHEIHRDIVNPCPKPLRMPERTAIQRNPVEIDP
jgi:hypothetical protein